MCQVCNEGVYKEPCSRNPWNLIISFGRPVMHFFRAGLFAITLTIAFFTASTSAAPLPITQSLSSTVASTSQSTDLRHHLRSHALHTSGGGHVQQAFAVKTTNTLASESDGVALRDVVGLERRNIFSKIKHAFQVELFDTVPS
jgi:hypothetical protein